MNEKLENILQRVSFAEIGVKAQEAVRIIRAPHEAVLVIELPGGRFVVAKEISHYPKYWFRFTNPMTYGRDAVIVCLQRLGMFTKEEAETIKAHDQKVIKDRSHYYHKKSLVDSFDHFRITLTDEQQEQIENVISESPIESGG